MCAMIINVKEKINSPSALTREQGQLIYDDIISSFSKGDSVILDFADIESLITPFLNVAIGKLYENYSSEELKKLLDIKNFPRRKFRHLMLLRQMQSVFMLIGNLLKNQ